MFGIANGRSMKSPVVIVTLSLAAAILLTASLLVAAGTRGDPRPWPPAARAAEPTAPTSPTSPAAKQPAMRSGPTPGQLSLSFEPTDRKSAAIRSTLL
jgi:predicted small lipoprotein YifL